MSAKVRVHSVEPGIDLMASGRYRLRIALGGGSTKSVTVTVDTLETARAVRALGKDVRSRGEDVALALNQFLGQGRQQLPTQTKSDDTLKQCRTFTEIAKEFQQRRWSLVQASDPTYHQSKRHGKNSLRESTHNNTERRIKRLSSVFGPVPVCDIDRQMVEA